ncbi:MAG: polysaccharide deacetylase family protein [Candidatus Heimdallarchaeota archaeon]|nr:MAG: polysaccharide deacetylase family protein [Candidatus Heimdallarchaeota archaeon]
MRHYLTIDLESWVHRSEIPELNSEKRKKLDNGFIKLTTKRILRYLQKNKIKLTFFVVSEIYEWYPELIEQIQRQGHEIGFHSFKHSFLKKGNFLESELKSSEEFLGKFKPKGFRAPEMHITLDDCQLLADSGFQYDSSIYGSANLVENYFPIREVPVSTYIVGRTKKKRKQLSMPRGLIKVLFKDFEIPYGSGFFIGLMRNSIFRFIRHRENNGLASVMFIHPWQIFPSPLTFNEIKNEFPLSLIMFPYYINCKKIFEKMISSLELFPIQTMFGESSC